MLEKWLQSDIHLSLIHILKEFVRKVRFDRMGAFAYSEEEGTYAAAEYEDSIPQEAVSYTHLYSIHCQRGVGEVDGEIFDFHPLVIADNL